MINFFQNVWVSSVEWSFFVAYFRLKSITKYQDSRQVYGLIINPWQSYDSIFFEQLDKYLLKQVNSGKFMLPIAANL